MGFRLVGREFSSAETIGWGMSPLLLHGDLGGAHHNVHHTDLWLLVVYFWNMLSTLSCWKNMLISVVAFRSYLGVRTPRLWG